MMVIVQHLPNEVLPLSPKRKGAMRILTGNIHKIDKVNMVYQFTVCVKPTECRRNARQFMPMQDAGRQNIAVMLERWLAVFAESVEHVVRITVPTDCVGFLLLYAKLIGHRVGIDCVYSLKLSRHSRGNLGHVRKRGTHDRAILISKKS